MKTWKLALASTFVIAMGQFVYAAEITDKQKCFGAIKAVQEMKVDEDTPAIGDKAEAELDVLVKVSTHLCELRDFEYAAELIELARGMLVSE